MNSQQTIHDMTVTYIEQALSEVKLLHDPLLIEPTLKRFHILRSHARLFGFAPKPRKFRPFVGIKPRAIYTVTDKNGTPLGDPIHEDDLGEQYAELVIERVIEANLTAMLTNHTDLVDLYNTGDSGAAPSFRYKPATALAERTDTEASLEQQKATLREDILHLRQQHADERINLNAVLNQQRQAENALDDAKRKFRRLLVREKKAQQIIDQAVRTRKLEALKRGLISPPGGDVSAKEDNDLELG